MPRSPAPSDITSTSSHYNNYGGSQNATLSNHSNANHTPTASSPLSQSQRSSQQQSATAPPLPPPISQLPPAHNYSLFAEPQQLSHPPLPLQPHHPQFRQPLASSMGPPRPTPPLPQQPHPSAMPPPPPPPPLAGYDGGVHPMPPPPPPPYGSSSTHTHTHPTTSQQQHQQHQQHQQQLKEQQQLQHQLQQQYAGSLQQQQQQQPSTSSGPRLHPGQLPRPPLPTHPQESTVTAPPIYYTRQSMLGVVPPPADTRFAVADDTGNASPNVVRSSLYTIPQSRREWHETGDVPWGVLCTPLAIPTEGEWVAPPLVLPDGTHREWSDPERVPLIRLDSIGNGSSNEGDTSLVPPPRCSSCQAYANPFVADDGTCNFCGHRQSRSLLQSPGPFGTVEFPVDGPYVTREEPVRPVFLYALDLTCPHIHDYVNVLEKVGRDLTDHWQRQAVAVASSVRSSAPPHIGVCVFSSAAIWVHALSTATLSQPAVCLMSDVTEQPFAPLPLSDWTLELSSEQDFQVWSSFLHQQLANDVSRWKEELRHQGPNAHGLDCWELSCGGAALAFLSDALRESGGRGTIVTWRRPNFGVGRLSHRDERRSTTMGGHEDLAPYTPVQLLSQFKVPADGDSAQFYRDLGLECTKNRISLDVVMHCDSTMGQAFLDLATLGELCRVTCGKLLWIPMTDWQATLQAELRRQVQSHTGWDAIFKLRCSAGVQVKSFLCNPGITQENLVGSPELELSSVSPSTTLAVELEHRIGGIPKGNSFMNKFVYLQSALLYTNSLGHRRMRVSTLALPVSTVVKDVYKSIDFSATAALLMRKSAFRLHQIPPEDNATPPRSNARAAIYHECLHILSTYRKVATGSLQQLLLPETLRLLPLFCMGLMKSPMLRPSIPTRLQNLSAVVLRPCSDERAYFNFHASQASPSSALLLAYPRVFPLTGLKSGAGEWVESTGPELPGLVKLPNALFPTMETLEDDGVYLIDGGLRLYLWIGRDVPPDVRTAVHSQTLSEWNPAGDRVVWQLRAFNTPHRGGHDSSASRPVFPPLLLAHEGQESSSETSVLDLMVDDAICGEKDYGDFLMRMHQAIRALHKT